MNQLLSDADVRIEIGKWMSELFDKDMTPDKVKEFIEKLVTKIASAKLKSQEITLPLFKSLCRSIENESK